jgi:broad specificity phosphatase PhoE
MSARTLVETDSLPPAYDLEPEDFERDSTRAPAQEVFLVRHGETSWTLSGQHTGATDIPLTADGRAAARRLEPILARERFALVLTSPLHRARETTRLAGFADLAETDLDLREWDYGDYEGLTPNEIEARAPGWNLFRDGCPHGESPGQIGARVDRVIERIRAIPGHVALFAHGHLFRVLAARWLRLPPGAGQHFLLDTATLNILSYYHGIPAIKRWNASTDAPVPERLEDA